MAGGGLADLLNMQEDRGTAAVLDALRSIGVMRDDRENDCLVFKEARVSGEALHREIERNLRRR